MPVIEIRESESTPDVWILPAPGFHVRIEGRENAERVARKTWPGTALDFIKAGTDR